MDELFHVSERKSTIGTELRAGLTTFLAMAYIIAVNPAVLSDAGIDAGALACATCLGAGIMTICMGIFANRPLACASGLGINAMIAGIATTMCGGDWHVAMSVIFLEGIVILLLVLCGLREAIMDAIPVVLRHAISVGLGLFIAMIGLCDAGIITAGAGTLVGLGDIASPTFIVGIISIVVTVALASRNVPGSLLIGILATALIGIPMGVTHFSGVVDTPPSVAPLFCQFEFHHIFTLDMLVVVFTFLFIDMFDTMGTLVGVCTKAGMMQKDGRIPGLNKAFMADAVATMAGACLGASTTTTYVESAAGVAQGGRSGLTAFSTAVCFAVAMFFAPLFLSIPAAATTPVLVIVGLFMLTPVKDIDLDEYAESIPAFITIVMMPLTYSISDGILCGVISYVLINMLCMNWKKLNPTLYVLAALFIMKYIFI